MGSDDYRVLYARATYGEAEREAVREVLDRPESLVGGDFTDDFEAAVADLFGKAHGVMVNSGSSANLLAVELLDLPPGTEVITPVVTFSTTVAPLVQRDLEPVFVDVGLRDFQIDVDAVDAAITEDTGALMIPNLLGNVPDVERLSELAEAHDLVYVEDSADTIGATVDGLPTGEFSDISTTSFYGSHVITAFGGGGMVSVDDADDRDCLRVLRSWGRSSAVTETNDIEERYRSRIGDTSYDAKFVFEERGYNFLPLESSAAFGLEQLEKLPEFADRRRRNFARLRSFLETHPDYFLTPLQRDDVETSWLGFPVTLSESAPFEREALAKYLEHNGIQTRPLFTGNALRHPAFEDLSAAALADSFPTADRIMRDSLVIGCHQSLDDEQLRYVEETIESFLRERG